MAALPPWDDLIAGRGCPFCAPRPDVNEYWMKVADLSVSTLYLDRNQTYRGYCVMVFNPRHVTGIEHLTSAEYVDFFTDLHRVSKAVAKACNAEHMNYATLGNVIPHLHYHVIPRKTGDVRWGAPVWTDRLEDMASTKLTDEEYADIIKNIRAALNP